MDKQIHEDIHELRKVSSRTSGDYAPLFYAALGFIPAYFLDGVALLNAVTFTLIFVFWIALSFIIFKNLSIKTKCVMAANEALSGLASMNVMEYGLNAGAQEFYVYCTGAIVYLLFSKIIGLRLLRIFFS